ncbi:MAG: hypothetical protein HQK65_23635, partial [Desulfamplus sp.]|nr:hypothetical protein [Desulfamplus sp.]
MTSTNTELTKESASKEIANKIKSGTTSKSSDALKNALALKNDMSETYQPKPG